MRAGQPLPPGLAGVSQQCVHPPKVRDSASDSNGTIPHLRTPRRPLADGFQRGIDPYVQCGRKGIQVGVHDELP